MKRGAIFDMDGLLLDTERLYQKTWADVTQEFGQILYPDFPSAVSGTSGEGQRQIILRYYPDVDAYAFQDACISRVDAILDQSGAPEKPGVSELLPFLRANGVKTALASSGTRQRILTNLGHVELTDAFDVIVGGPEVTHGKPAPDIFLLAAKKLGCPPEDCWVFEDSANGVRAGLAAGCVTVMVPDLVPPPEDLRPSRICASLQEAHALIEAGEL